jgi:signal transduction histidine kinase
MTTPVWTLGSLPGPAVRDLARSIADATSVQDVVGSVAGWVRFALETEEAEARVVIPDGGGRLRVSSSRAHLDGPDQVGSSGRRRAFRSQSPVRLNLTNPSDRTLVLLPLVCRGMPLGILEVEAPRGAVEARWELLEAVAAQLAVALRHTSEEDRLKRQVETLERAVKLGRDLVRAPSPEAATRIAVRFLWDRFRVPIAAWVAFDEAEEFVLTEARGLGKRNRKELQAEMAILPTTVTTSERRRMMRKFGEILGIDDVAVVDAGGALLLAARYKPKARESLDVVGSMLEEVLRYLREKVHDERRRSERLDLGLAWTAHEVRGPLLGVKAVLEFLMRGEGSGSRTMLRRSLQELEQLAGVVEGLLHWAVGAGPLRRREVDLARVVRQAVESCELEMGDGRVSIDAPHHVRVRVDPGHLRGAIANLIRNALSYSPPDAAVDVLVERDDRWATVSVTDRGPGIPPSEREAVFEPLVRGATANGIRNGKGLGLFIARRVVQAHGGEISLKSDRTGSTFQMRVPLNGSGTSRANPPR